MEHNTNTTSQPTQNCHLHFTELHNRVGESERDFNDTQTIMNSTCERNICNNVEATLSDDVMTLPYKINHMQNTNHTKPLDPSLSEVVITNSNPANAHYEREQLLEEQLHEESNLQCYKVQQEQQCDDNKNNPSSQVNNVLNETLCNSENNRMIHTEPRVHCDAEEIHLYSPPSDHRLPHADNSNIINNRESMNNNNRETDYHYEQYHNNDSSYSDYNNNYYYNNNEMQDDSNGDDNDVHTERMYVTRSHVNDNYDKYHINNNINEEMKTMKGQLPTILSQPTCTHSNTNLYSNNLLPQPQQEHLTSSHFKHVAVFVNPGSGNTDVARYIKRSLSRILLPEQVMLLNKNVFAHPEIIRHVMRKYAVIYHNKEERQDHTNMTNPCTHYNPININCNINKVPCTNNIRNANQSKEMHQKGKQCNSVRGTVLVAGGDGTVSFIMSQLDILRSELEESIIEEKQPHQQEQQQQQQRQRPPITTSSNNYHVNSEEATQNNYLNHHYESELKEEDDDETSDTCSEHSSSSGNSESIRSEFLQERENQHHKAHKHTKHKWYTLPALAPLPLGTGNDFSNSVGFGHGFNRSVARQFFGGCCQGCLGWCKRKNKENENEEEEEEEQLQYSYNWNSSCHNNTNPTNRNNNNDDDDDDIEHENNIVIDNNINNCSSSSSNPLQKDNSVVRLLRKAINAPCVPFDRWAVDVIPLCVAQEYFVHGHIPFCSNTGHPNSEKCGKENIREEELERTNFKHEQQILKEEMNSYNNTNDIIINYNNAQNEELEAILQADRENTHSAHYPSVVTVDDQYAVSVINKSALINSNHNINTNKNIREKNDNISKNNSNDENTTKKANNEPHYRVLSEANAFLNKVTNENEHSPTISNLSHVNNINIIADNNINNSNSNDNKTVKETVNDTHPSTYTYTNTTINNKTLECSDNTIHNIVLQSKEHQELQQKQKQEVICNSSTNDVNDEINMVSNNGVSSIEPVVNDCYEHDWQNDPNVSSYISRVDWHGINKDKKCKTHSVMNYFSIGYDAYIVCQFDKTRKAHPLLCSSRIHNKAIYGLLGLKAAVACQSLRKLIPLVYVPTPTTSSSSCYLQSAVQKSQVQRHEQHLAVAKANYENNDNNNKSKSRNIVVPSHSPISAYNHEQHNYANETNRNEEIHHHHHHYTQKHNTQINNTTNKKRDNNRSVIKSCTLEQFPRLTSLQLPSDSKVLLLTNIHCYASGTHPWRPHSGTYYYKPVTFHPEHGVLQRNGNNNSNINNVNSCSWSNNSNSMSMLYNTAYSGNSQQVNLTQNLQQDANIIQNSLHNANTNNNYVNTNYCANHSTNCSNNNTSNINANHSTNHKCNKPPLHDIYINDRAFELQALGGLPHYSVLQAGITGAAKMAQTHECFIFVLCTPADLCEQPHSFSAYTSAHYKKYMDRLLVDDMMKASLNLQMDGEALPRITEPCIIHVRPLTAHRVRVRCLTEKIILHHHQHHRNENNLNSNNNNANMVHNFSTNGNSASHHLHLDRESQQK